MSYTVKEIQELQQSATATILCSLHYPPKEIAHVINTQIALWEVESSVGSYFTLSYWKSFFKNRKKYSVIVQQKDPLTSDTHSFLLHYSDDLNISQGAYSQVCSTLKPFVDDCTLVLTEKLLKVIILPAPKKLPEVVHCLAEVMESNPDAHSDWVKVLQTLVLDAIGGDDNDVVEDVLNKTTATVDVRATNRDGNTALHLTKSTKNAKLVIKKATENLSEGEKKKLLNRPNQEGKAPLHTAFQKNNVEVVTELIQAGAEFDMQTQDEDASNPFHLAAESGSAESVAAAHHRKKYFLQKESLDNPEKRHFVNTLNTPNKRGYTPLMISVRKDYVNSTVTFLQAGADPDTKHPDDGNTALHYAAERGNTTLLKALIAFGADIKLQNNAGKEAVEVAKASDAKGAKESVDILNITSKAIEQASSKVSDKFNPITVQPNSIFLLSMDGGGTRGLLLTQTLMAIQKRMRELKVDCEPVYKCFDYIAGTSAGGLVTLSVVHAKASLEATRASLFKASDDIAALSVTFPDETISRTSQETYGKETLMTDVQTPRVIITTVLADRNPPTLHLLCNYGEPRNGQKPPNEWKVWETSRATSAAPVYFPPFKEIFIDGGVMANNPTLDAMVEIITQTEKEGSNAKLALVVSIGTGVVPSVEVEDVGIYVPNLTNPFNAIINLPNTLSALGSFLNLLISQSTASYGQETNRAGALCKGMGVPYYRLSVPLPKVIDLAETDKAVLTDMLYQGHLYLLDIANEVDMIARYLLSRSSSTL